MPGYRKTLDMSVLRSKDDVAILRSHVLPGAGRSNSLSLESVTTSDNYKPENVKVEKLALPGDDAISIEQEPVPEPDTPGSGLEVD